MNMKTNIFFFFIFFLSFIFISGGISTLSFAQEQDDTGEELATGSNPDKGLEIKVEDPPASAPITRGESSSTASVVTLNVTPPSPSYAPAPSALTVPSNEYTLADLKILAREKSYQEFFEHALDLRPSLRGKEWSQLVKNMAESYVIALEDRKQLNKQNYESVEKLVEWPVLHDHGPFLEARARFGPLYFQSCFERGPKEECLQEMANFGTRAPLLSYASIQLGELALFYAQTHDDLDYWPYFAEALQKSHLAPYCLRPSVKKIIFTYLRSKAQLNDKELASEIDRTLSPECFKNIKEELLSMLAGSQQQKDVTASLLSFRLLQIKHELSSKEKLSFLTRYLLNGPENGVVFNQAWNSLSLLGQDALKRQQILEELKRLDPLPGDIFASANAKRRDVILDHLHRHFPEYMDTYARTCIDYLRGQMKFTNGNPTLYCHDLFAIAKPDWIESSLFTSYNQIPNIDVLKAKKKALE